MGDDEHIITAAPELRRHGEREVTRYRGRCSCGRTTYMHYSTPASAKSALRHTHDDSERQPT